MNPLNRLPLTRLKIGAASLLYKGVSLVYRDPRRRITRSGIRFEVDLTEGIDLSLFLFGGFQRHVARNRYFRLAEDAVVLDVGANAGIMTLQFAARVPRGHVYSFEPTHHAAGRLRTNLGLNPTLAERVTLMQTFVSDRAEPAPPLKAFASWKVDGDPGGEQHPVHLGTVLSTEGVGAITVDRFAAAQGLARLDLIKIDTDGHELDVLRGAAASLECFRPAILFEVGLYAMRERGIGFADYEAFLGPLGYRILDARNGREITAANHRRIIPGRGTIDALALPAREGR